MKLAALPEGISQGRIADDLWALANCPSPTGREREAAFAFAGMLERAGAAVEVDETLEASPNIIGRLRGRSPGPTLQLAGHIDHIDVPHPAPERGERTISARGAADMKAGVASILEIVRVLKDAGCPFPGAVLVTVYGLHEAPVGHGEGLQELLRRGVKGDAALVLEGPPDRAVVCGKGQSIWNLLLSRDGESCHELRRPARADGLIEATLALAAALRAENERLRAARHGYALLGPESVFLGQLHYGDFYNRVPVSSTLQGTWRWHPDKSFAAAQAALHQLVLGVPLPPGVRVQEKWTFVGESFSVDPSEPIVASLRAAYEELHHKPLEIAGVCLPSSTRAGSCPSVGSPPCPSTAMDRRRTPIVSSSGSTWSRPAAASPCSRPSSTCPGIGPCRRSRRESRRVAGAKTSRLEELPDPRPGQGQQHERALAELAPDKPSVFKAAPVPAPDIVRLPGA